MNGPYHGVKCCSEGVQAATRHFKVGGNLYLCTTQVHQDAQILRRNLCHPLQQVMYQEILISKDDWTFRELSIGETAIIVMSEVI